MLQLLKSPASTSAKFSSGVVSEAQESKMSSFPHSVVTLTESQSLADKKRHLYVNVFKREFIRELVYLWDVANNRAAPRDTFTKKMVDLLTTVTPDVAQAAQVMSVLGSIAVFAANQERDASIGWMARLIDEVDLPRLEILIDVVAQEALRRYESFIVNRLSDQVEESVIPFAKVGVARILEYLSRHRTSFEDKESKEDKNSKSNKKLQGVALHLTEATLLAGLVEGRSGSFIEGWFNHKLAVKKIEKGKEKNSTLEAEDVYGRSGLRHFAIENGQLVSTLYSRKDKGRHQEKLVQSFFKGDSEALYNFGYVKFRNKQPHDPKCGYAIMPLNVITERYGFTQQSEDKLSPALREELHTLNLSILRIDKKTFQQYLSWYAENKAKKAVTMLDFIRQTLHYPDVQMVQCQENISDCLLTGVNLSHMNFNGVRFTGDLTGVDFSHSYLIGADFSAVTSLKKATFYRTQAAFIQAEDVDFAEADLTQANFSYGKLNRAKLNGCTTQGTIWHQAALQNTQQNNAPLETQKQLNLLQQQLADSFKKAHLQEKDWQGKIQETSQAMYNWQQQQTTLHKTLERFCQEEIHAIQQTLRTAVKPEEMQRLNLQLLAVQTEVRQLQERQDKVQAEFVQQASQTFLALSQRSEQLEKTVAASIQQALQIHQTEQEERLKSVQQALQSAQVAFAARLEQVEKRVNVLESWAAEAKPALEILKKNNLSLGNLETQVKTLLESQAKQEAQHHQYVRDIQSLQQTIGQSADKDTLLKLQKELAATQAQLSRFEQAVQMTREQTSQQIQQAFDTLQKSSVNSDTLQAVIKQLSLDFNEKLLLQAKQAESFTHELTELINSTTAQFKEMWEAIDELTTFAEKTKQQLKEIKSEEKLLQQDIQQLDSRFATLVTEQAQQLARQQQVQAQMDQLQEKAHQAATKEELEALRQQWQALQQQIPQWNDPKMAGLLNDIQQLKSDRQKQITELEQSDRALQALGKENSQLRQAMAQDIQAVQAELQQHKQFQQVLESLQEKLTQQTEQANARQARFEQAESAFKQQLQWCEQEINLLKTNVAEIKTEQRLQATVLNDCQQAIQVLKENLLQANASRDEETSALRAQIESRLQQLAASLQGEAQQTSQLRAALKTLQQDYQRLDAFAQRLDHLEQWQEKADHQLTQYDQQLQTVQQQLKADTTTNRTELSGLQKQVVELKDELTLRLNQDKQQTHAEMQALQQVQSQQMMLWQTQISDLNQAQKVLQQLGRSNSATQQALQLEMETLKVEISNMKTVQKKVTSLEEQLIKQSKTYEERFAQLQNQWQAMEEKLKKRIDEIADQVSQLSGEVVKLKNGMAELATKQIQQEAELKRLESHVKEMKDTQGKEAKAREALENQIKEDQKKLQLVQQEITRFQAEAKEQFAKLSQALKQQEQKPTESQHKVIELTKEVEKLQNDFDVRWKAQQEADARGKKALEEAKKEFAKWKEKASARRDRLKNLLSDDNDTPTQAAAPRSTITSASNTASLLSTSLSQGVLTPTRPALPATPTSATTQSQETKQHRI